MLGHLCKRKPPPLLFRGRSRGFLPGRRSGDRQPAQSKSTCSAAESKEKPRPEPGLTVFLFINLCVRTILSGSHAAGYSPHGLGRKKAPPFARRGSLPIQFNERALQLPMQTCVRSIGAVKLLECSRRHCAVISACFFRIMAISSSTPSALITVPYS